MSNYLIKGETLTNVANAIREKTGSSEKILISDMLNGISQLTKPNGEIEITENGSYNVSEKASAVVNVPIPDGYIQPSGSLEITENGSYNVTDKATATVNVQSGLTINGIIEQYKVRAGKTLNAGDFVEFTKFWLNDEIPLESDHIYYNAVALTENKLLMIARINTSPYQTKSFVLTIEGDSIIVSSETVLDITVKEMPSLVALTENKVLVAYKHNNTSSSSSCYGKAVVLTIEEDTVTVGSNVTFHSNEASDINACKLSESKVLVAYAGKNTSTYADAIILTIDGTTITLGTLFTLGKGTDTTATALTEDKVLLCYKYFESSPYYGVAVVLTISGTTITAGTSFQYTESTGNYVTVGKLTETKAIVVYQDTTNSNYGTAQILTISGTTITGGNPFVFYSSTYSAINELAVLNESTALILNGAQSSLGYMRVIILTIADSDITSTVIDFEESFGTYRVPITLTSDKCLLITEPHSGSYNVRTRIVEVNNGTLETFATPPDTVINGIANTSGTAGETVEVYVPIPKGYTVTINNDFPYSSQYSLDDGQTWIDLDSGETVLTEVKTIKFNWNGMAMTPDGDFRASIGTTENGTDIINNWSSGPSSNITISEDTTFYIWHSDTTSMGGGGATP